MIISFAFTAAAVRSGVKTVTRRMWKDSHAAKFKRGMVVDAWGALPFAGGQKFGTITLDADPYQKPIREINAADIAAEGFAGLSAISFLDLIWIGELGGSLDDIPWVVPFHLRSLVILAKMKGGQGRRYEAFFERNPSETLASFGWPFGIEIAGRREQVYVDKIEYIGGQPFYTLEALE